MPLMIFRASLCGGSLLEDAGTDHQCLASGMIERAFRRGSSAALVRVAACVPRKLPPIINCRRVNHNKKALLNPCLDGVRPAFGPLRGLRTMVAVGALGPARVEILLRSVRPADAGDLEVLALALRICARCSSISTGPLRVLLVLLVTAGLILVRCVVPPRSEHGGG